MNDTSATHTFRKAYTGRFISIMSWSELAQFWEQLKALSDQDWYIYATDSAPPNTATGSQAFCDFINKIDTLLRTQHEEDYCSIVFVDSKSAPSIIKIYDPNNLGVVCGYSDDPPLPGWILSRLPPAEIRQATARPPSFWRKVFF
ncbi:MAG: hypothetical protein BMS9Abin36_0182 [Gammaproteobacteria bacterium]|nr:MAG: hypothetical protein BMS9Abin36_0182 [Gammaproteobacteria bacterium]